MQRVFTAPEAAGHAYAGGAGRYPRREALRAAAELTAAPQPVLQCNASKPARWLSYDRETVLAIPTCRSDALPLPDGAMVRFISEDGVARTVASIPSTWPLALPAEAFALIDACGELVRLRCGPVRRYDADDLRPCYTVGDVRRETLVGEIERDVADFLRWRAPRSLAPPRLVVVTRRDDGSVHVEPLDPAQTARDADLFNRARQLCVLDRPEHVRLFSPPCLCPG